MADSHVHRKGTLSQQNKPFKGQGHKATKGELKRAQRGRVLKKSHRSGGDDDGGGGSGGGGGKSSQSLKKEAMVRQEKDKMKSRQQALREKKKHEAAESKRLGGSAGAPKIVGFVSLRASTLPAQSTPQLVEGANTIGVDPHARAVRNYLLKSSCSEEAAADAAANAAAGAAALLQATNGLESGHPTTVVLKDFRQRLTLLETKRTANSVLDVSKVADLLVLVVPVDSDTQGLRTVTRTTVAADGDADAIDEIDDENDDARTAVTARTALTTTTTTMRSTRSTKFQSSDFIDARGEQLLTLLKAQGVPSLMLVLTGLDRITNAKKQNDLKKRYGKWIKDQFPGSFEPRVVVVDSARDGRQLSRWIHEERARTIGWRERRSYMAVEKFQFFPQQQQAQQQQQAPHEEPTCTLAVFGYLRGMSLSANQLIHLCNFGTFQIDKIVDPSGGDPCPMRAGSASKRAAEDAAMADADGASGATGETILDRPTSGQESLQTHLIPAETGNEQTWPTKEDMLQTTKSKVKRVPKGFSDYQAAWIADDDQDEDGDDDDDSVYDDEEDGDDDDAEGMDDDDELVDEDERAFRFNDAQSVATTAANYDKIFNLEDDENMDEHMREAERDAYFRRIREQQEDQDFPDEVDTPKDVPARVRFQRFRGLKSFRNSPWDPKESLPIDYARIFQFENFERSQKLAYKDHRATEAEHVQAERYVGVYLRGVPASLVQHFQEQCVCSADSQESNVMLLYSLMRHEQKMSLVHLLVRKVPGYEAPVRSKDPVLVQVGFRSFYTRPVYSEHNPRCDKSRLERFMQPGRHLVMSMYAPVTYRPAPVLVYHPKTQELIATGQILAVNPDRIILKKIVLPGHLFKVHKRHAVVRYMFYGPDDVRWFKPVELHTRQGRVGAITEPLGTHGYMKCAFDDKIQAHDVVLMPLYKRVYPKWSGSTALRTLLTRRQQLQRAGAAGSSTAGGSVAMMDDMDE